MGTLPTWLWEKVFFLYKATTAVFLSVFLIWQQLTKPVLKAWQKLGKIFTFLFLLSPPSLPRSLFSNFSWMGQGRQSLSSLPLDWVRRLRLNVWFKIVLAFPASCFFFPLFLMALGEARNTMSNRPQSNHLRWAHNEGINAFYMRMPSLRWSPLSNMWENALSLSLFYLLKL